VCARFANSPVCTSLLSAGKVLLCPRAVVCRFIPCMPGVLVASVLVLPRECASGASLSRRLCLPSGVFVQSRVGVISVQSHNFN
jgi:hypothetical protein